MNSLSTISFSLFCSSFWFFLFIHSAISNTDIFYNDHCSSLVPETRPTSRLYPGNYRPHLSDTNTFFGGENLLSGAKQYNHSERSLRFWINPRIYETVDKSIYKIEGYLTIRCTYYYIGKYSSNEYDERSSIRFQLHGFWSVSSNKICMVGSGSERSTIERKKDLKLDVVIKFSFASDNPNMYTSVVSGTLQSLNSLDDPRYFDPISVFSFYEEIYNYNYSLVSGNLGDQEEIGGDFDFTKNESLVLEPSSFCTRIHVGATRLELLSADDSKASKLCSPHDGDDAFLHCSVDLRPIHCSSDERKVRYVLKFQNTGYYSSVDEDFHLNSTFLAEGVWDDKNNRILIVACGLHNPAVYSGNVVGDCSLRLSLRFPSVWTIRQNEPVAGQIWTNKSIDELGYFKKIKLASSGINVMVDYYGLRYVYTELDTVRRLCVAKELAKKKGNIYPNGHSYDMRFGMSVKSSKEKPIVGGFAQPISVENEMFERYITKSPDSYGSFLTISPPARSSNPTVNISYKLNINFFEKIEFTGNRSIVLNSSLNENRQVVIDAEGMYNSETGQLCMVGCRKLKNESLDCDILVNMDFAPLSETREIVINGTIRSTRTKGDALHFEELSVASFTFYRGDAKWSIWRMDLEITMVLISNTLICILLGVQIFHVKRNPEVLSGISLLMLMVLALGLVVPLVLNFEALFFNSNNQDKQRLWLSSFEWIEDNEVPLGIITMIAFLLQIRLFQLTWSAKFSNESETSSWVCEKKTILVSLLVYLFGGLGTLLLNWIRNIYGHQKYFVWADLRSYFGLILDGFLFPQVILNAYRGSADKSLAHSFYIGTSVVQIAPHAYDQYRAHNYLLSYVNIGNYYYADHAADMYSTAWNVIIPCGAAVLAVIVFFQQRRGGRCILPNKFGEDGFSRKLV